MKDENKTKKQLINELVELRQRIIELKKQETEHKRVEEALQESEEKYRELVENLNDVIYSLDDKGVITYISPNIEPISGYKQSEIIGNHFVDFIYHEDKQRIINQFQKVILGHIEPSEYRFIFKSGRIYWIRASSRPVYKEGRATGLRGVLIDITERKRIEEALKESESRFRSLFDLSPQAIALTEVETGKIVDVNDKFCELTQYDKKDVLGRTTPESCFYSGNDRKRFVKELRTRGEVHRLEMDFKVKDGSILNALMFSKIIQLEGKPFVLTIFFDMTEHKRAEEKLRESKEKYRIVFDQAADLIAIVDIQGNFLDLNKKFEEESGWSRDEMNGKNVFTSGIITEASAHKVSFHLSQLILGKEPPIFEVEGVKKDGGTVPFELRATPIIKDDKIVAVQAILRNITERKQAEEILKNSEEKYRSLVESTEDSIYLIDRNCKYLFMNKKYLSRLGLLDDENF
ncbi:MAG: PAS domain S-box protein, partial [Nitrospirota bacterium]|nr:PAS domain S-box protein [Nitrospirota bacterium]